jgi:CubicO group peptidase (beta-lactamase class C family)
MILFAGCAMTSQNQPAQTRTVDIPSVSTSEKNIASLIPQFDAYTGQLFSKSKVPGMAVAIVKNDSVIYLRTFGVKNLTTKEPVGPDTRFQLASISKTFSSASIASMVGRGELAWDDRVVPLYPGFRLSDPWITDHVTIRDLLMHRTGLPAYGGDELQDIGYNRSEIISKLHLVPLTGDYR